MAEEIPTFESMFRKSRGLDSAEEATPTEMQYAPPQGEVHDADKLKMKKSAGFREMLARSCFEKTGRIPDVAFMDTYEVKKAADEADFNEMSDGFAAYNKEKEIQDTIDREHEEMEESGIEDGLDYRLAERVIRDDIEEGSETDAGLEAYNKYDRKKNKPIRKELSDTANWMRDAATDTAIAMAKDPTPHSRTSALMEGDLAGEIAADIPGIYHEINPFLNKSEEFFTALDALLKKNPNITPDMIVKYMQPAKVGYNKGYERRSQERMKNPSQ